MTGEKLDADGVKIDAPSMWRAPFHPITLTGEE